ncbi:MAG: hypothetical protein EZS28_005054 [Streblomastix strix]|uniref:Uncharacterized protein n=1 Tax=Streblomastix strix TaxID=222440 RepID=A0A5J4WYK4_9EUKA|nr:MAG: hypothetical protein EZS28_005054 [Streblomastix strix]
MGFNIREGTGNDSNCSWNLEQKISEGNKQQQRIQSYYLGLTKFRKSLEEFANPIPVNLKRQQYSSYRYQEMESINISNKRNQTGTLDNKKLGIKIQITHFPEVKNEIVDALSRLSRAGDCKLMEKNFQQACLQMNLNSTIDLFSQHFNNLLPRFMSTIRGHGEVAIDALNQTWKKELPWIHSPIPFLPAILKKIKEEQFEVMIIAPLWPGQIWYKELVNKNAQSLMLGCSNEILEPGKSQIKMNFKLSLGKICCFLRDLGYKMEEDSQERL